MRSYIYLQWFEGDELILTEEETVLVLKFIFEQVDHGFIDSMQVNDRLRSFAQSLLVMVIDRSYNFGFVDKLFRSASKPGAAVNKVLLSFGKKALKHWFKHAAKKDLLDVKVYESIRLETARTFRATTLRNISMYGPSIDRLSSVGMWVEEYSDSSKRLVG